jgi:hypothetical protein
MRSFKVVLPVLMIFLAAPPVLGEDWSLDPNLNPAIAPEPVVGDELYSLGPDLGGMFDDLREAFGPVQGANFISATEFTHPLNSGAPGLSYESFQFYTSAGSATPTRYFAQLDVAPGLLVSHLACAFRDASAANNVSYQWQRYTANVGAGTRAVVFAHTGDSAGSPGVSWLAVVPPAPVTITVFVPGFTLIHDYIAADVAGDTSIAGCWVFWNRQISPPPGAATFSDVPSGHQFFPEVEALVKSGITGGCGGGNYCPNQAVTRGQMAAFLARSLGLTFQY